MLLLPLVATVPLQAPEAEHEVALLEDQVKVALAPLLILVGLALKETFGAGVDAAAIVVTVTDCSALPPVPVQVKVYSVVEVNAEVVFVPLTGTVPLQPPEAVHEVAFVASQLSFASLPLVICAGLAESETAGVGAEDVLPVDPPPVEPLVVLVAPEPVTSVEPPQALKPAKVGISSKRTLNWLLTRTGLVIFIGTTLRLDTGLFLNDRPGPQDPPGERILSGMARTSKCRNLLTSGAFQSVT